MVQPSLSYREQIDMRARRLLLGSGFMAFLVMAPSLVFGQTVGVRWRGSLDEAKVEASQTGRLVLLHFWSPNCGPCRKLESAVFPMPQVGAAIEKNYVPVKIDASASSAMAYAYKVDRVPSDVILTAHGNVLATYTSPLTQQGYLAKLGEVVAQFGGQRSRPAVATKPQQVNAAYAGLQGSQMQATSTPVANLVAQGAASNVTPATSALATSALNPPPSSQPSQAVDRYALPDRQYHSSPKKTEVPANAMPSSYRNPYMAQQMQTSAVHQTSAVAYPSQQPTTASTVPQAAVSSTVPGTGPATATVATKNASKTPSVHAKLPAGSPPLGFDGYCPVSLKFDKKWVRGDVKYGAIHRGRTYLFVGEGQRQQFLANPDAYSPVFSGMDPVAFLDSKQTIEGSRRFGFEYRGAFYLFSSSETMQKFASQPDRYAVGVRQAMVQLDAGSGTLRR